MKQLQIKRSITDRSDTALNSYLKDINRIPLLSREEEKQIAIQAKAGNIKAKEKLVTSNLRFVVSCAKQYQGQGIDLIDLISEGNAALWECVDKYDPNRGFKFISYAVWWIRQAIMHSLNEHSRMMRLPRNQILQLNQVSKITKEFEQEHSRLPSSEEISNLSDLEVSKVNQLYSINNRVVSYDTTITDDSSNTLIEIIPNNNSDETDLGLTQESTRTQVNMILNLLTDREHDILKLYFGINCQPITLYEISNKFGLTHERTRQLKNGAIEKLKTIYLNKVNKIANE